MKSNQSQKNIPKEWTKFKLGDICQIKKGEQLNRLDMIGGAKYPVLNGGINYSGYTTEWNTDANTITISEGGNSCGYINFVNTKFWSGGHCYSLLNIKEDINKNFLYQILKYKQNYVMKLRVGSGLPNIQKTSLQEFNLEIPTIFEQKKIAEILSKVDEEINKTDELISKTKKLKSGLIKDIFNFKNKKDVKYLKLGDIGKVSMCKRIFKKETSNTGEIPFYKIGTFGKKPDSFISQKLFNEYRNKFSFPKIGDILLSASGTIGRKVIYNGEPAYFQDSNIIWLEHDENMIVNKFLFYLYDTITWETEGSTIKRLYNNLFLKKIVPVPPIDIQDKIYEKLSSIDKKLDKQKELKEKLTQLKKGLMSDLLSGKIRVNI